MSEIIEDTAKFLLTASISFTVRNPLEALAGTAIISNPTTRGLVIQIAKHQAGQMFRDLTFYSRLIGTNVVAPAGRRAIAQVTATATTPIVAIPATAIVGAAVGAAVSAGTTVWINDMHNVPSSSPIAHWSPFGGMGFGSVVT
jgi:hypothetical protein|tara:strand:- start:236 stop:664 length:429 start_codon:yes stop_codon:yes gene_type:complete